jgi:UPF0755 protein
LTNDAGEARLSPFGLVLRVLIAAIILAALGAALMILYRVWLGEGIDRRAVNPNLSQTQRLYLEYYLSEHAAGLEQAAGVGVDPMPFVISPGEGAAAIAENLRAAGLLTDSELFLNYLTYYGLDSGLVAGQYTLDPRQTVPQLAAALGAGGARALALNFLPGWRSEEMANYLRVVNPAQIDANAFQEIVASQRGIDVSHFAFLAALPAGASLEGYLFPDTYTIEPDEDSAMLINRMVDNFDRQVTPAMRQAYGAQGLSLREAVILASIVEKEATLAEEKPLIAGVFLNRLRAGMPLQADPTVQYALGYQAATDSWWKSPLEAADLTIDSAYNTYQVNGLPPGPIANPGLASLEAVAAPAASDYLFFVLDCANEGRHAFSVTYEEHLAHVERCR